MIKKRLIPIIFLLLILINNTKIHAEDFSNPAMNGTEALNDFSMDMMMDQSHMAIDAGNEGINDAEETNIMNHQLDDSTNVLLNDSPLDIDNPLNTNPSEMTDALVNGNWSDSFNDYFNSNDGETNSDINFYNNESQGPGDGSNGNDSPSTDMPQLEFANDESISSIDTSVDNLTDDNTTGLIDNTTVILNNDSHDDLLGNNTMPSDDVIGNDSLSSFDVSIELPSVPEIKIVEAPKTDDSNHKDDNNNIPSSDNNTPSDGSSHSTPTPNNDDDDD